MRREKRQLEALMASVFLIGIIGLIQMGVVPGFGWNSQDQGDVYVECYKADLFINGTLKEQFTYKLNAEAKYRMLYRSWASLPVSQEELAGPYVELQSVSGPVGSVPYLKNWRGNVCLFSNQTFSLSQIDYLADIDEIGCYEPRWFRAGIYEIGYTFTIHPPLECDSEYCHWNLAFADKHLPYRQATITIHDPKNLIVQLFPRMPMPIDPRREGDSWIMTGSSPENGLLEVEMLLKPEAVNILQGFPETEPDVEGETLSANSFDRWKCHAASALSIFMVALVLLAPLLLLLIHRKYGAERAFTAPGILGYVPNKRKPWMVNLIFKGEPLNFDQNGFYATLLDLQRRKVLSIKPITEGGICITLPKCLDAIDDRYERNVLKFLMDNSTGDVFNSNAFEQKVKHLREQAEISEPAMRILHALRDSMTELMNEADESVKDEFASSNLNKAAMISLVSLILVAVMLSLSGAASLYPPLNIALAASFVFFIQFLTPLLVPAALFGKWNESYYKEKQEWESFKAFLSDFAMIQMYTPEYMSIWRDWLVYGTALGVGDKVVEALDLLNVPSLPEAKAIKFIPSCIECAQSILSQPVITKHK